MSGRLIAIVGPSGVGKDSVMAALAEREPRIRLAQRVITRPSATDGEVFDGVSEKDFQARVEAGQFVLSWSAHGFRYGISKSINAQLEGGQDVLANLSRMILREAKDRFPRFEVIGLTADKNILADRLAKRDRETADEIASRLDRATVPFSPNMAVHEIDNSGSLAKTVDAILERLYPAERI